MKKTLFSLCALLTSLQCAADWSYNQEIDAMTGKKASFAHLVSTNSLSLGFPYKGDNHAFLSVRQRPRDALTVLFSITKGQFVCRAYDSCYVDVRFDDATPTKFAASGPADHSTTALFLNDASRFVALASKAKRILVQANIYQEGAPILEFSSTTPLAWNLPAKAKPKPSIQKPVDKPKPQPAPFNWPSPTTDFAPSKL